MIINNYVIISQIISKNSMHFFLNEALSGSMVMTFQISWSVFFYFSRSNFSSDHYLFLLFKKGTTNEGKFRITSIPNQNINILIKSYNYIFRSVLWLLLLHVGYFMCFHVDYFIEWNTLKSSKTLQTENRLKLLPRIWYYFV